MEQIHEVQIKDHKVQVDKNKQIGCTGSKMKVFRTESKEFVLKVMEYEEGNEKMSWFITVDTEMANNHIPPHTNLAHVHSSITTIRGNRHQTLSLLDPFTSTLYIYIYI